MHYKSTVKSTDPHFAFFFFRSYYSASFGENRVFPFRQGHCLANVPNYNAKYRHGQHDSYTSNENQPCHWKMKV